MRTNHMWTDEERAIIRRDFKHTRESRRQLANHLSQLTGERITEFGVAGQVAIMGIAKSDDRHPWSPEQDAKLMVNALPLPPGCSQKNAQEYQFGSS